MLNSNRLDMNPDQTPQSNSVLPDHHQPAAAVNPQPVSNPTIQPIISPPIVVGGVNNSQPTSHTSQVLKQIQGSGTFAIVLGILEIILSPVAVALQDTSAQSGEVSKTVTIIGAFIYGLIAGAFLIWLGIKLKKTTLSSMTQANKTLIYLEIVVAILLINDFLNDGNPGYLFVGLLAFTVVTQFNIRSLNKKGAI